VLEKKVPTKTFCGQAADVLDYPMERYKDKLSEYFSIADRLSTLLTQLTMNIKEDREGLYTDRTQFSKRLYELNDSIQYRLSAVGWHLLNLCSSHSNLEVKFKKQPQNDNTYYEQSLYFIFDDFIFNLLSLYDFYANFIGLSFIDDKKQKIMWGGLARSSTNPNNEFSLCELARAISEHNRNWAQKLQEFRAEIIHYNVNKGNNKKRISWTKGEDVKYQLLYSIPENLVKLLKLDNSKKNDAGIDLQFGAIKIGKKSISVIIQLTELAIRNCTNNSVKIAIRN